MIDTLTVSCEFTQDELATEKWRSVPGCDGYYASTLGRMASTRQGHFKPLLRKSMARGYYTVSVLRDGDVNRKTTYVHTLIASTFIGIRPDGLYINHKNGIKTDNRVVSLEYITQQANIIHAVAMGLITGPWRGITGDRHGSTKIKGLAVTLVIERYCSGESVRSIADSLGVCQRTVRRAMRRRLNAQKGQRSPRLLGLVGSA